MPKPLGTVAFVADAEHDRLTLGREVLAELLSGHVVAHPEGLADDERLQLRVTQGVAPFFFRSATVIPAGAFLRASADGVYQIGELQARSCPVSGTTSGGGSPDFTA